MRPWLAILFLAIAGSAQQPASETLTIAPGVEYSHRTSQNTAGEPLSIHVLKISRAHKELRLVAIPGQTADGRMARVVTTELAQRLPNALAVVNSDFDFTDKELIGTPTGLSITSGQFWTGIRLHAPVFSILQTGAPLIDFPEAGIELEKIATTWKFNKPLDGNDKDFGIFSAEYPAPIRSKTPIQVIVIGGLRAPTPLPASARIRGEITKVIKQTTEWRVEPGTIVLVAPATYQFRNSNLKIGKKVYVRTTARVGGKPVLHALGGFPVLVREGKREILGNPEGYITARHPRTAVCYNTDSIIFTVVDGRQPKLSMGLTLEELADLEVSLGCTIAMNLDGGGSSLMAIAPPIADSDRPGVLRIVNSPSDGKERPRPNAWVLVRRP